MQKNVDRKKKESRPQGGSPLVGGTALSARGRTAGESRRRGVLRGAAAGHCAAGRLVGQQRVNGRQQLLASSKRRDTQLHQVVLGQRGEHLQVDFVQHENFCKDKYEIRLQLHTIELGLYRTR